MYPSVYSLLLKLGPSTFGLETKTMPSNLREVSVSFVMSHSADFKDSVCKKNSKEWTTYPFQEFRKIAVRGEKMDLSVFCIKRGSNTLFFEVPLVQ